MDEYVCAPRHRPRRPPLDSPGGSTGARVQSADRPSHRHHRSTSTSRRYLSVVEALRTPASPRVRIDFDWIDAEVVASSTGRACVTRRIVIPGGFGERGIEGMIAAGFAPAPVRASGCASASRFMVVDRRATWRGWTAPTRVSSSLDPHPVIDLMEEQVNVVTGWHDAARSYPAC